MTDKFQAIIQHLETEFVALHVGRVTPKVLDNIVIDAYNSKMPLVQLASITNQDAQTLLIQPWDGTVVKAIEKGLYASEQNITPTVDGTTIRVHFPPLTEEKRRALVKTMRQRCEDAHISVKRVREDLLNDLKNQKKAGTLSEDVFFSEQKQLQKEVDECNSAIDSIGDAKEKDLMTI